MVKPKMNDLQNTKINKQRIMQRVNEQIHQSPKNPFMKLPIVTVGFAIIIGLFLLFTFRPTEPNNITLDNPILYETKLEEGELTFSETEKGYQFSYYDAQQDMWHDTTPTPLPTRAEGFDWTMLRMANTEKVLLGGVITDAQIQSIHAIQFDTEELIKTLEVEWFANWTDSYAEIVDLGDYKIWYLFLERLIDSSNEADPLRIEALNAEKEVIWREGVYNDGLENGYVTPSEPVNTEVIEYELTLFKPDETVSFIEPYSVIYKGPGSEEAVINFIFDEVKTFDVELRGYEWKDKGKTLILDLGEGIELIQGSTGGGMFSSTLIESYFTLYPELQTIVFSHYHSFKSKLDHFGIGFPYRRE